MIFAVSVVWIFQDIHSCLREPLQLQYVKSPETKTICRYRMRCFQPSSNGLPCEQVDPARLCHTSRWPEVSASPQRRHSVSGGTMVHGILHSDLAVCLSVCLSVRLCFCFWLSHSLLCSSFRCDLVTDIHFNRVTQTRQSAFWLTS